jgi:hypothetical protein
MPDEEIVKFLTFLGGGRGRGEPTVFKSAKRRMGEGG